MMQQRGLGGGDRHGWALHSDKSRQRMGRAPKEKYMLVCRYKVPGMVNTNRVGLSIHRVFVLLKLWEIL